MAALRLRYDAVMAPSAETLPQLLLAQALRWGNRRVAIREKEFGIWQAYTWRQYADNVQRIALGLASLGFRRGDKVAVIGDNRPQLYWTMVAAQALGGVPRSEERRVGKECTSWCRSRWSPYH